MKNSILIICTLLAAFGLTAFGFVNWNHTITNESILTCGHPTEAETPSGEIVELPDFLGNALSMQLLPELIYKVESRFMSTITKEKLLNAKSILDIYPKDATESIMSYQSVQVSVLAEGEEITEFGMGEILNADQKSLLQTLDYQTQFYIRANCKKKNKYNDELFDDHIVYYMSVTPEHQAEYIDGHDALIEYLKENSKDVRKIVNGDRDALKPGKVSFTVSKTGSITNVKLGSTSGYDAVDNSLMELIRTMPGHWKAATNAKGENVDQELVFFFGLQGC